MVGVPNGSSLINVHHINACIGKLNKQTRLFFGFCKMLLINAWVARFCNVWHLGNFSKSISLDLPAHVYLEEYLWRLIQIASKYFGSTNRKISL